jgi:hypothetical protein
VRDFLHSAVEALVQAALGAEMTEAIGAAKGERSETRLFARQRLLKPIVDHPGWHAAVAGAAGSDTPMRGRIFWTCSQQ